MTTTPETHLMVPMEPTEEWTDAARDRHEALLRHLGYPRNGGRLSTEDALWLMMRAAEQAASPVIAGGDSEADGFVRAMSAEREHMRGVAETSGGEWTPDARTVEACAARALRARTEHGASVAVFVHGWDAGCAYVYNAIRSLAPPAPSGKEG